MDPDFPNDPPFETIWRENHTISILALFADENGKIEERILTHGIWKREGNKVYLLDLITEGTEQIPREEQAVKEYDLKQVDNSGYAFEIREEGEPIKTSGLPVEKFTQPEMQPFNTPEALKRFDLLGANVGPKTKIKVVKGTVKNVDPKYGFITISIGETDTKKGDTYRVTRGGKFVGTINVYVIRGGNSFCKIDKANTTGIAINPLVGDIKAGDDVELKK